MLKIVYVLSMKNLSSISSPLRNFFFLIGAAKTILVPHFPGCTLSGRLLTTLDAQPELEHERHVSDTRIRIAA